MIQVDMHVHSRHSRHPAEWFLQRIGAQESYTDVEQAYRMAKARGMTYVTLTDHNTIEGALELHARHPEDTFVSAEVTAYFPEDGCKVHILVYGVTAAQFESIQSLRRDIRQLRDYLRAERIVCSVAHATYSVNDRMSVRTLEKLVLLFDVFEGINGGRSDRHNRIWSKAIQRLTPEGLERLRREHGIEPWSCDSWIKGMTGGSDDHAGLLIGETYTLACDATISEFLDQVRARTTRPAGRHADHRSLACAVYKIAHEFSRSRNRKGSGNAWSLFNALLFKSGPLGLKERIAVQKFRRGKRDGERVLARCVKDLLNGRGQVPLDGEARITRMYDAVTVLSDGFFSLLAQSLAKDLQLGETGRLLGNVSAALPAFFLLAPFLTVLRHMHGDRGFLRDIATAFDADCPEPRSLLWFSDTVLELNGVAVTVREIAGRANVSGRPMKLVTCLAEGETHAGLPPNVLFLPCIYNITPGFYNAWTLRLPSLLSALDLIAREAADQIVISTPGPVGLVGLVAARLLRIPCVGVYHTDFTRQTEQFIGDSRISSIVEACTRGFFTMMDEVRVPTTRYMEMLAARGLDPKKMKLFRRGIEPGFAVCDAGRQAAWRRRLGLPINAPVLLWAGRLGREKNVDFLFGLYKAVAQRLPDARLVLVGDGPERARLQSEYCRHRGITFAGRVERTELPHLYGLADVFVFPSTTDTFGMVVLEAQSCGLPVIVSDVGGPQELVVSGETGFVVEADKLEAWTAAVLGMLETKREDPEVFARMRAAARAQARNGHGWDGLLDEMLGPLTSSCATARRERTGQPAARGA